MAQRKNASPYAALFEKKPEGMFCKLCASPAALSLQDGSTSHLKNHLEHVHKIDTARLKDVVFGAPTSTQATLQIGKISSPLLRRLIVRWLVTEELPMSTVDSPPFRDLLLRLAPGVEVPVAQNLTRKDVPELHAEGVRYIKGAIGTSSNSITWLSDGWTDSYSSRSYVNLVVNIVSSYEPLSFCLATRHMSEAHTAANMAEYVNSVFAEYGIDTKKNGRIFASVTDNGKNFTALVQNELRHFSIPCVAHTLNLVVKDAITASPSASELIEDFAHAVDFFHRSTHAMEALAAEIPRHEAIIRERLQRLEPGRKAGKQLPKKLKLVCSTKVCLLK